LSDLSPAIRSVEVERCLVLDEMPNASITITTSGVMSRKRDDDKSGFPKLAFEQALGMMKLNKRARNTGAVLAVFMDGNTGECFPGVRTLDKKWGIGRKRLQIDLVELLDAGVLEKRHRDGRHGSNIYVSLASFLGGKVVLSDGRELHENDDSDDAPSPAACPPEEHADIAAADAQRAPQRDTLTGADSDGQRAPFEVQRVLFDTSACPSEGHGTPEHPTRSVWGWWWVG
jgi:hypothetical protein